MCGWAERGAPAVLVGVASSSSNKHLYVCRRVRVHGRVPFLCVYMLYNGLPLKHGRIALARTTREVHAFKKSACITHYTCDTQHERERASVYASPRNSHNLSTSSSSPYSYRLREKLKIHARKNGVSGWAVINDRLRYERHVLAVICRENSRMLGLTLDARCRARAIQRSAPQRSPVADSDTDP